MGILGTVSVSSVDSRLVDEVYESEGTVNPNKPVPYYLEQIDYDDIPESTKFYADFLVHQHSLGSVCKSLSYMDEKRTEYHLAMCKDYALPYERTRVCVAVLPTELLEKEGEKANRDTAKFIHSQMMYELKRYKEYLEEHENGKSSD